MHLAVFFMVNVVVATAIGAMAYLDGHDGVGIALRVGGTLLALQAAYAAWILAVALLSPSRGSRGKAPGSETAAQPPEAHSQQVIATKSARSAQ